MLQKLAHSEFANSINLAQKEKNPAGVPPCRMTISGNRL
jgi:hypothetical protein